nr:PREDICTED: uncharacterized protein LOC103989823 isoform X1 [Musa acuminata subsp. malaccensis]
MFTKEVHFSDVTYLFSGAFKIVTKHLKQDNGNIQSSSKPQTESLLAQVNTLRQELQLLASSRSVTIVTGANSGSGTCGITAVIVFGAVGYLCIWWKGWKVSDMMFVTRRGLSDACTTVGKQLELISASIATAKRHLSQRIDRADINLEECKELATATKCEVSKLHGDLGLIHTDVESVHRAVQTLETKLFRIEDRQDFATQGVYHLCQYVEKLEQSKSQELIQDSPSSSSQAIELPQATPLVTKTDSLPPLTLETPSSSMSLSSSSAVEKSKDSPFASWQPTELLQATSIVTRVGLLPPLTLETPSTLSSLSSPSSSRSANESSKIIRPSTAVSASGLKEVIGSSGSSFKASGSSKISSLSPVNGQPSSNAQSSRSTWRLPDFSILTRIHGTMTR